MTYIQQRYGRVHSNREANTNLTLFHTREHAAQQKYREHPYRPHHDKHPKRDGLKIAVYNAVLSCRRKFSIAILCLYQALILRCTKIVFLFQKQLYLLRKPERKPFENYEL